MEFVDILHVGGLARSARAAAVRAAENTELDKLATQLPLDDRLAVAQGHVSVAVDAVNGAAGELASLVDGITMVRERGRELNRYVTLQPSADAYTMLTRADAYDVGARSNIEDAARLIQDGPPELTASLRAVEHIRRRVADGASTLRKIVDEASVGSDGKLVLPFPGNRLHYFRPSNSPDDIPLFINPDRTGALRAADGKAFRIRLGETDPSNLDAGAHDARRAFGLAVDRAAGHHVHSADIAAIFDDERAAIRARLEELAVETRAVHA